MRHSILDQLVSYSQLHLLAHHKLLKQSKEEEADLMEDLSYIDFATIDFVGRPEQLYHNMIRNRRLQDVVIDSNIWESRLRNVANPVVKQALPKHVRDKYYLTGLDLIARGKAAVVLYASEYAFFGEDFVVPSLEPLPIPSQKTNLQILLERVHYLSRKGSLS